MGCLVSLLVRMTIGVIFAIIGRIVGLVISPGVNSERRGEMTTGGTGRNLSWLWWIIGIVAAIVAAVLIASGLSWIQLHVWFSISNFLLVIVIAILVMMAIK